ncbi:MAG: cupin domain-containing protein [Alphaproteobacteria bacterium]|nr:cupin domain-containing protein [Alphaproteobacteria bacterium]
MTKIDVARVKKVVGTGYPKPYDKPCLKRSRKRLGDAAKLTQFGVNLLTLKPGVWSAQRHWHTKEDEFIFIVKGEVVLVTDTGEQTLRAGDCAGFKAGKKNGHHLQNRSKREAVVLEVGTRSTDDATEYPGIDLRFDPKAKRGGGYTHRNGKLY